MPDDDGWMTGPEARDAIGGDAADMWDAVVDGVLEKRRPSPDEPWQFRFTR